MKCLQYANVETFMVFRFSTKGGSDPVGVGETFSFERAGAASTAFARVIGRWLLDYREIDEGAFF